MWLCCGPLSPKNNWVLRPIRVTTWWSYHHANMRWRGRPDEYEQNKTVISLFMSQQLSVEPIKLWVINVWVSLDYFLSSDRSVFIFWVGKKAQSQTENSILCAMENGAKGNVFKLISRGWFDRCNISCQGNKTALACPNQTLWLESLESDNAKP